MMITVGVLRVCRIALSLCLIMAPPLTAQHVSALSTTPQGRPNSSDKPSLLDRPAHFSVDRVTLPEALTELYHQTGVPLVFGESLFNDERQVSCDCASRTVGEALDILLDGTGLRYTQLRTQVVIEPERRVALDDLHPRQTVRRPIKLPDVLRIAYPVYPREVNISSQAATIRGVIRNREGDPIPAVSVMIESLRLSTITNRDGAYMIMVPADQVKGQSIVISARSVGYRPAEEELILTGGVHTLDFELEISVFSLDEIVVTGVVDPVEGAKLPMVVGKMTSEDINAVPSTGGALNVLQGKMSGVQLVRGSGQPGEEAIVSIRAPITVLGSGSLMYIVDGVILGEGTVDIETLDIESIEVIKGAAAASLYGSRAAAGVIQITTRRGIDLAEGTTRISARTEYGWSELSNLRVPLSTHHRYLINEDGEYVDED